MSKILYTNKINNQTVALPIEKKVRDVDMNEIKTVVNENDTTATVLRNDFDALESRAGSVPFSYVFDASTSGTNPLIGTFRINTVDPNTATYLYISASDLNLSVQSVLESLIAESFIYLQDRTDPSIGALFEVISFTDNVGWFTFTITPQDASTTLNDGAQYAIQFLIKGVAGAGSGTVTSVTAGDGLSQTGDATVNPTIDVGAGQGILVNSNDVALQYFTTGNFIQVASNTLNPLLLTDTILWNDEVNNIVHRSLISDLPFTNNTGTMSTFSYTDGDTTTNTVVNNDTIKFEDTTGIIINIIDQIDGGIIEWSLDLDAFSEKTGLVTTTDRLLLTSGGTEYAETIGQIPLTIFDNDLPYVAGADLVAGDGITGTTYDGSTTQTWSIVGNVGVPDTVGTLVIDANTVGVSLGTTAAVAAKGNHLHTGTYDLFGGINLLADNNQPHYLQSGWTLKTLGGTFIDTASSVATTIVDVTFDLSATGTPDATTFLRGDNTWATIGGGGTITEVSAGNGMDFTTVTSGAASIVLGAPSDLSGTSLSQLTPTSHTHAITTGIVADASTDLVDSNAVYDFVTGQGYGTGTVTSVSSATTSQLTISESSPAPILSIVLGSIVDTDLGLVTGDAVFDYASPIGHTHATTYTSATSSDDTTTFPIYISNDVTGFQTPRSNPNFKFNEADGQLGASSFTGDYIQFNTAATPTHAEGKLHWNSDEGTLELGMPNNVIQQIGQESFFLVKNQTGSTILNGTPVMYTGSVGVSGRILIQPAIADGTLEAGTMVGVLTEDILNGNDGYSTFFGKVRGIQTDGINYGETWTAGDILYVSPTTAGYLTNVKPSAPDLVISVAVVVVVHATVGTLLVRPTWNLNISDLNDVNGTPPDATNNVLLWDNVNSYWDAGALSASDISDLGANLTAGDGITGNTYDGSTVTDWSIVSNVGAAGTIGTLVVGTDDIGVSLGTTAGVAAAGNHTHTGVYDDYDHWTLLTDDNIPEFIDSGDSIKLLGGTYIITDDSTALTTTDVTIDLSATGAVGAGNLYLADDNVWSTPPNDDTTYTYAAGSSATGTILRLAQSGGTNYDVLLENGTYIDATYSVGKSTIDLSATGTPDGTKYLRDDNTWVTPPTSADFNDFVTAGSFNSGTGDVTLTVPNQTNPVYNLDGRYELIGTNDNYNNWKLRDGDTTVVTIGSGQQINLIEGGNINIDWTDTVNPYELTLTAQNDNTEYTAGGGLILTGTVFSIDYLGVDNFINIAPDLEGTAIALTDTIVYHDATDENVKKGLISDLPYSNNLGTVTGVTTSTPNQLSVSETSPAPALSIITGAVADLGTALATGDQIYDFVIGQGYGSGDGSVTQVNNGNGMNFVSFTDTGTITLGTPTTLTASTTNAVQTASHTHEVTGFSETGHTHANLTAGNGITGNTYNGSTITDWSIVSNVGAAGTIGTLVINANDIGVSLGTTAGVAAAGNHLHTGVYDDYSNWTLLTDDNQPVSIDSGDSIKLLGSTFIATEDATTTTVTDVNVSLSATGTTDSTTFLRGDNTWAVPPSSAGDITQIVAGAGMDFTTVDSGSATIVMGTPQNVTGGSVNETHLTGHTHEVLTGAIANLSTDLVDSGTVYTFVTGQGYGQGIVESLTTTGTSGVATLITGVLNIPNYANDNDNNYISNVTQTAGVLDFTGIGSAYNSTVDLKTYFDTQYNNFTYTLPAATTTVRGGIELESATVGNAANAITSTASRTYGLQVNSSGQGVINVPWTDNNDNDNDFVTGASFNTGTGVITLTISNQTPVTVDIDGRYSTQTLTASEGVTLSSNDIQMNILNLTAGTSNDSADSMVYYDATAGRHVQDVMSDISLSQFDNDALWNNYSLPFATATVRGGIELASNTVSTPTINSVTAIAGRSYGLQLNSANQGVINVPWTDTDNNSYISNVTQNAGVLSFTGVGAAYNSTVDLKTYFDTIYNNFTYSLPFATATVRGGIELFSNTDNPTAANAVTSTAGRTYGLQLNSANQGVVNVPWTDTDNNDNDFVNSFTFSGGTLTAVIPNQTHPSISLDGRYSLIKTFDYSAAALTGAVVFDDINVLNGFVDAVSTRTLTLANLGYTGSPTANDYTHPTVNVTDLSLTGAEVMSSLGTTTEGHVDVMTKRTLTLANLGYTGSTSADNYNSWGLIDHDNVAKDILSGNSVKFLQGNGIDVTMSDTVAPDYGMTITNTKPNVVQTISLTGDVVGSGTGTFATTIQPASVDMAMLNASGTSITTKFLRGDGSWQTITSGSGTVTEVTTGTGLGVTTGTTTPDVTLDFDGLTVINSGVLAGNADRMVVLDGTLERTILFKDFELSLCSNDANWTNNTGTVTAVNNGNGMNFTNITGSGTVTLGTPTSLSGTSTNAVTTSSHTHAITTGAVSNGGSAIPNGNYVYDHVTTRIAGKQNTVLFDQETAGNTSSYTMSINNTGGASGKSVKVQARVQFSSSQSFPTDLMVKFNITYNAAGTTFVFLGMAQNVGGYYMAECTLVEPSGAQLQGVVVTVVDKGGSPVSCANLNTTVELIP